MKLNEVANYIDRDQAIADFEKEKEQMSSEHDRETHLADMIISQYEMGELSYEEALQQLKDQGLEEWEQELIMADELKKDPKH